MIETLGRLRADGDRAAVRFEREYRTTVEDRATVRIDGQAEAGVAFPYSRWESRSGLLTAFFFGLCGLSMALSAPNFADSDTEVWVIRLIGLVLAVF
ncbi:MAG: hypothetical protein L0Y54_09605, partial [Sporichthyaceae bacterium]|nr:hypothetical protein [Sporichthyaceae bacterium]